MFDPVYHALQSTISPGSILTPGNAQRLANELHQLASNLESVCAHFNIDVSSSKQGHTDDLKSIQRDIGDVAGLHRMISGQDAGPSGSLLFMTRFARFSFLLWSSSVLPGDVCRCLIRCQGSEEGEER
jgi:hypothetical protein